MKYWLSVTGGDLPQPVAQGNRPIVDPPEDEAKVLVEPVVKDSDNEAEARDIPQLPEFKQTGNWPKPDRENGRRRKHKQCH